MFRSFVTFYFLILPSLLLPQEPGQTNPEEAIKEMMAAIEIPADLEPIVDQNENTINGTAYIRYHATIISESFDLEGNLVQTSETSANFEQFKDSYRCCLERIVSESTGDILMEEDVCAVWDGHTLAERIKGSEIILKHEKHNDELPFYLLGIQRNRTPSPHRRAGSVGAVPRSLRKEIAKWHWGGARFMIDEGPDEFQIEAVHDNGRSLTIILNKTFGGLITYVSMDSVDVAPWQEYAIEYQNVGDTYVPQNITIRRYARRPGSGNNPVLQNLTHETLTDVTLDEKDLTSSDFSYMSLAEDPEKRYVITAVSSKRPDTAIGFLESGIFTKAEDYSPEHPKVPVHADTNADSHEETNGRDAGHLDFVRYAAIVLIVLCLGLATILNREKLFNTSSTRRKQ